MSKNIDISSYATGIPVAMRHIAERIGLVQIFNEMLPWDQERCKLPPGIRFLALILMFLHDRTALYQMKTVLATQDLAVLFGADVDADSFTDDALARALDKLYEAKPQQVFTTVCTQAVNKVGLSPSELISKETLEQMVYVADSALVTRENLQQIHQKGMRFISRIADRFSLTSTLMEEAWAADQWEEVGTLAQGSQRNATRYRLCERPCELDGIPCRAIVVHSSGLAKGKEKSLQKKVEKEAGAAGKAIDRLCAETYTCKDDAQAALQRETKQYKARFHRLEGDVIEEQQLQKRTRSGRPRKGEEPVYQTVYRLELRSVFEEERLQEAQRLESTFVLLTNVEGMSRQELLKTYKGQQNGVEISFRVIKELPVSPMFLKKPHRVEAMAWLVLIAYLLYTIIQYEVRARLQEQNRCICSPVHKQDPRPTGRSILDMLYTIRTIRIRLRDGTVMRSLDQNYNRHVLDVLELLQIPL